MTTSDEIVYAFLRPFTDSNGLTVVNIAPNTRTVTLDLSEANLKFSATYSQDSTYWLNNHYSGTSTMVLGSELQNLSVELDAYGSAVYTISPREEMVVIPQLPPLASVHDIVTLPEELDLLPNYPNPFNPVTTMRFHLPEPAEVQLIVFDIGGRQVRTLLYEERAAGYHEIPWDGTDALGNSVATGVYLARIEAAGASDVIKMIYLK